MITFSPETTELLRFLAISPDDGKRAVRKLERFLRVTKTRDTRNMLVLAIAELDQHLAGVRDLT